jgi:hypothetical protein
MTLIITGIFIQFLGLAVQVIQLRRGRSDGPGTAGPAQSGTPSPAPPPSGQ